MDWSYVAGFIDGEGTITFARGKTGAGNYKLQPRLLIGQKKPEVLYMIQELAGEGLMLQQKAGLFVYQNEGVKKLPAMLENLLPYLIIKKRQAEVLLDYCKCRTAVLGAGKGLDQHCLDLDIEMRALNLRGGHPDKIGV
jgi:hypothetical protein